MDSANIITAASIAMNAMIVFVAWSASSYVPNLTEERDAGMLHKDLVNVYLTRESFLLETKVWKEICRRVKVGNDLNKR